MLWNKLKDANIRMFRHQLASADALPQLAFLGLISGTLAAVVIVIFRFAIEWPLSYFLPDQNPENFEGLHWLTRGALPLSGAIIIGLFWYKLQISQRKIGIAYVMERLGYHQGYITFKSALIQFFAGIVTMGTGHSAGREGPAVHLGAAFASLLGQKMKLPNNSIRTLVGCGTAAAISASFDTPVAGVIFAMEVVMMEYTIAGFTPVILASVSAAIISQSVYGSSYAFVVPQLEMSSLMDVPFVVAMGVVLGTLSAIFVRNLQYFMRFQSRPIFLRILAGGVLTALAAMVFPEIMGIGYDTVNQTILGELSLGLLCAVALVKLFVTATSVGLGMPSGIIGPTLFIGATAGGAMGVLGAFIAPESASSTGFYAMLGMGAMMGAVLQAPLAALMALLELTHNPNIILPGMLIIIVSSMVASEVFKQRSVFLTILKQQGLDYHNEPVIQALRRVSVGSIMERNIHRSNRLIDLEKAKEILVHEPKWIIIDKNKKPISALPTADLARHIEENNQRFKEAEVDPSAEKVMIDLLEIPAQRRDIAPLYYQATLQEAMDRFSESSAEALLVEKTSAPMIKTVLGIITRADIDSYYQYKRR
ncbi:chloride channel protein [Alkalimarinus alittae]|uniref:Chloride channel protein n=1 Tax=Alkalimarinus alittae TaxID=2961619 RepID=A0ABY6N172_9ALTE|nr:chloride channel protein [Alkalimarinus alittae]UZE95858.1 chloride channel protein [Alkalimarinus alittae]